MSNNITLNIDRGIFLPIYLPYIETYDDRYNIYWGGRASGKTYFLIEKLLIKGLKEKRVILLMRKETNKLKDSVWKELILAIDRFQLRQFFDLNKSEFRAVCKVNGTEFKCLGLDEPEKIKGFAEASDVLLDELTAFTMEDWELIDGTIRSPKYELPLQLYGSFNPVSKVNWVYKYFGFDKGITPPNTFLHHSTYLDNTYLDSSYFDRMNELKERNPNRYKIEAEGLFVSLDKLVFPYFTEGEPPIDKNGLQLLIGLDFGYTNDPTALVCSWLDEQNKKLYIFDEFCKVGMLNDLIASMIVNKGYSKDVIIADSAELKSIEEIKRCGIGRIKPAVKGKDSILSGILKIQQYDLVVSNNCPNVRTELENYTWEKDKSTNEYINKPIDMFNHCLDALRYSILTSNGKIKTISKEQLGL